MPLLSPKVGAAAPPLELPAADGSGARTLAHFRGRPVVVSFLGPANCSFCRAHVIRAIQHHEDFRQAGAEVVFIAYHDPELLMTKMLRDLNLPYTLLLDTSRDAYRRWGLGRPTWKAWFAPGFHLGVAKFIVTGEPNLGTAPGPGQIGGDFVVDRTGRLAFVHIMRSFHDRAKMPLILSAVRSASL